MITGPLYHVYAKGRCIYHSLSKEKFDEVWSMLHKLVDLLDLGITKEDLQYEEITVNNKVIENSSY